MTENELRRLSQAERDALPMSVKLAAVLTTYEEGCDLLAIEGYEFLDMQLREKDVGGRDDSEVWHREIGGLSEWQMLTNRGPKEGLPPEQCWHRAMYDTDPRLIED